MKQHQPLRTPKGWKDQDATLVMQIDRLFDEVYRLIGQIEKKVDELDKRVKALEEEE